MIRLPILLCAPLAACGTLQADPAVETQIEQLNADLLASNSATAVLQAWCDVHRPGLKIVARREPLERPADHIVRSALAVGPTVAVNHRRVALACGDEVLSVADNWYLPDRLTPEMNRLLLESHTPFGVAVKNLGYIRRNLGSEVLLSSARPHAPEILRQRAVLETADKRPFSLVVETYQRTLLASSEP